MRLHQIINEARQAPLYHFTSDSVLKRICESDLLRSESHDGHDRSKFVSFTRNFATPWHHRLPVVLVMDQQRLAQREEP